MSKCKTCDADNEYYTNPNNGNICQKCDRTATWAKGCTKCKSLSTCQTCDKDNGWFLDSNFICQNCTYGCTACNANSKTCTSCKSGFRLESGKCQCHHGKYLEFPTFACKGCHNEC